MINSLSLRLFALAVSSMSLAIGSFSLPLAIVGAIGRILIPKSPSKQEGTRNGFTLAANEQVYSAKAWMGFVGGAAFGFVVSANALLPTPPRKQ